MVLYVEGGRGMDVLMVTIPPLLEGGDGVGVLVACGTYPALATGLCCARPFHDFCSQPSALTAPKENSGFSPNLSAPAFSHSFRRGLLSVSV